MIVPKLRFSEFKSEWQIEKLGDLVTIKSGYSPSKYDLKSFGEIPFLKVDELNNCDKYQEKSRFYSDSNKDMISKDSVIFPKRGAAILNNKVRILKVPALLDSNLMALTFNPKQNPEFYYYLINKIELFKIADTSTIPQINNKHIEPYEVFTTTNEEQTKIAEFLSAVDDKISQLSRQLELLNQYKKGVMQKIFSQEIRFKNDNGEDFREWDFVELGEICDLITKGTTPTSIGGNFIDQGINFIKIESITENGNFIREKFAFIDEDTNKLLNRSILKENDILFSIAGALGRVAIVHSSILPANTNQALAIIRLKNKDFTKFIYYFLNSEKIKKLIENESVQLAQANFSLGQLSKIEIALPSIQEQEKIAEFLTAIDEQIDHTTAQLIHTKQWKKGLLQQMFV